MTRWQREQGIAEPWLARERVLAALGPAPQSANLVRAAYRMATRLGAPWIALWVETPASASLGLADRDRINQHLALAERLGAEVIVLGGDRVHETVLTLARQRNITRILVGKPTHSRWRDRFRGSLVNELVRRSGPIDVIATMGEQPEPEPHRGAPSRQVAPPQDYLRALAVVLVATAVNWVTRPLLDLATTPRLPSTCSCQSRSSRGPALAAPRQRGRLRLLLRPALLHLRRLEPPLRRHLRRAARDRGAGEQPDREDP
jgi:two-component system sensor histidine kinase KdpD